MKASMHTHHQSKLIADVIVPRRVTNRRGHAMTHEQSPELQSHEQVEVTRPLRPRKPMSLARLSLLPGVLYSLKAVLPAWAPRKFTLEDGVQTNWSAALPSRQTLANTGVLTGFLIMAALAVWALPQKNTPQVIAEQPAHTSDNTKSDATPPQGTLVVASSSPANPSQPAVWRLPVVRKSSSSAIPALVAQSQPNASSPNTTTPQTNATQPTETPTTPTTGGEPTTPPTEPTTPPVDPPVDPPTEPEIPPIPIVDPLLESVNDLLDGTGI